MALIDRVWDTMEHLVELNDKLPKSEQLHEDFINDVKKYIKGEY